MTSLTFQIKALLNSILFCIIFLLGAATLFLHNRAIHDRDLVRQNEERREAWERTVLSREAAYLHFSLFSLRKQAREMGFVPVTDPRFVRRGEKIPSFAVHPLMSDLR